MKHIKVILTIAGIIISFIVASTVAYAQEDESVTVGIVAFREQYGVMVDSFIEAMTDLGYIRGENIRYVHGDFAENDLELQRLVAQEVIDAGVDLIFVPEEPEAIVVHELTEEIPVVFAMASDPIGSGLVADLTEPGGNLTGIAMMGGFTGRRLQLLKEIDPAIERVYVPYVLDNPNGEIQLAEIEPIAEALEMELVIGEIADHQGMLDAIAGLPEDVDAIFFFAEDRLSMGTFPQWFGASVRIGAGLSSPIYARIPGILMGYGPDSLANAAQAAGIVDQILRGVDPAEVPVQNAESSLMINLQMAQALGIEVPRGALRQAATIMRAGDDPAEATAEPDDESSDN